MKPTIFVTIYDGAIAKNILRTDVFRVLKEYFRIVLFVPQEKRSHYERLYGSDAVRVEITPSATYPRFERIFNMLALSTLHTHTVRAKIDFSYAQRGGMLKYGARVLAWHLGKFRFVHMFFRVAYMWVLDTSFDAFIAHYKPRSVFAPNMISEEDFRLIKAARRHGVQSIGMPKSWDNLTSKTFFNIFPDWMMVQNASMQDEALSLFGYPRERTHVVGFPQFDVYEKSVPTTSREDFCKALDIDSACKIILYAAAGHQLAPHDEEVLSVFIERIEHDEGIPKVHILVRPHPKYAFDVTRIPDRPFVSIDRPGTKVSQHLTSWEFDDADIAHLADSLRYADLLISTVSTLNIEGAIFDVPLISIGFDGNAQLPPTLSSARYYAYDHMRPLVASGGMTIARSADELFESARNCLADRTLHQEGRKTILRELVGDIGGSGSRVAEYIVRKALP